MNAAVLKAFFEDRVAARELLASLVDTREKLGADSTRHHMVDLDDDFTVTTNHLIKLCDSVLIGDIPPDRLEWIAFSLMASDHFEWDTGITDGERVADAIIDWSTPESNYVLNLETVGKFRHRLLTGENTLDNNDFCAAAGHSTGRVIWEPKRNP